MMCKQYYVDIVDTMFHPNCRNDVLSIFQWQYYIKFDSVRRLTL